MWCQRWRFWSIWAYSALGLAAGGCSRGDGLPRQAINGSVMLNGHKLSQGVITFFPSLRMIEGNTVVGGAMIENGVFSIPAYAGLIPGKYKIAIHSAEHRGEHHRDHREPGNHHAVPQELIPAKYNAATVLEIEINDHAIKNMKVDLASE